MLDYISPTYPKLDLFLFINGIHETGVGRVAEWLPRLPAHDPGLISQVASSRKLR